MQVLYLLERLHYMGTIKLAVQKRISVSFSAFLEWQQYLE